MKMMKKYIFDCMICKNKCATERSIKNPIPRFCSKTCYRKASPSWLLKKKFSLKNEEEKAEHIRKYYEKNIIKNENCWDWKKSCKTDRYPRMNYARSEPKISIHVYSWKINFGDIPNGLCVLHKCDNTRCSNPKHLFLGTQKDNRNDSISKNRHAKGSKHGCSKLYEEQVRKIKDLIALGVKVIKIAEKFNVERSTIDRIKYGKTWKHVL